ncbi:MAG TPA: hypothetical protein VF041_03915 [Gemmatimonadaceae bacterium]
MSRTQVASATLPARPNEALQLNPHDAIAPGSLRLELPTAGAPLTAIVQDTEALLARGREREEIFVWPAAEREHAARDVLDALAQRLAASGGSASAARDPAP